MATDEKSSKPKPKEKGGSTAKSKDKGRSSSMAHDEWIIIAIMLLVLLAGAGATLEVDSLPSLVSQVKDKATSITEIAVVRNTIFVWKIIAGIISVGSLGVMAVTIFLSMQYRVHVSTKKLLPVTAAAGTKVVGREKVARKEWLQFLERAGKATPTDARMLVIEADSIADLALQRLGYSGTDMGERMKSLSPTYPHTEKFWELHKLRNNLAHQPGMQVDIKELESAIHSYHYILMELGAI